MSDRTQIRRWLIALIIGIALLRQARPVITCT
jgi:hypothetical protein